MTLQMAIEILSAVAIIAVFALVGGLLKEAMRNI